MQQEGGNPLLPATALPKIKTKPAAVRPVPTAVRVALTIAVRTARPPAARAAPDRPAAHAVIPTLLIEAERLLLLKKALTVKAPSKANPTSKNSS